MDCDWDEAKDARCWSDPNHGFGFDYAARIFAGPVLERVDDRGDYGETRIQAIGAIEGLLYFVCYTDRIADWLPVRCIISARRAHRKERRQWPGPR